MSAAPSHPSSGSESALLPCPFCGSDDINHDFWASLDAHGPGCFVCGATAETDAAWNRRATIPDAAQAESERIADLQYEAGMYQSLHETAKATIKRLDAEKAEARGIAYAQRNAVIEECAKTVEDLIWMLPLYARSINVNVATGEAANIVVRQASEKIRALALSSTDRQITVAASSSAEIGRWPLGCHSPNSCSRNGRCMYVGCKHDGAEIKALAALAMPSTQEKSP